MAVPIMGVETEYALACISQDGRPAEREALARRLLDQARATLPHLPAGAGLFLPNGARLYLDGGWHPEFCTPECTNPWDVMRHIAAGEGILARLAADMEAAEPGVGEVLVFKGNVGYGDSAVAWGCHESYLLRGPPYRLAWQLIPHLVSRVIYCGAGGFDPSSSGLTFMLSPRARFISLVESDSSARDQRGARGIFDRKDEPLARHGYRRLHVTCGESLCSQTASCLKIGATALVVAMIDGGLSPGEAVALARPLEALCVFATDVTVGARVPGTSGRLLSAIEIQRHYLAQAEAAAGEPFMPEWAGTLCDLWRATLDRLEASPALLEASLDWAIKRRLYAALAARRGVAWDALPTWTCVAGELSSRLREAGTEGSLNAERILERHGPVASEVRRLTPLLAAAGLSWEGFHDFLRLGPELLEIDTRFGQLGGKGIFDALDAAGALAHRVPGVDAIDEAVTTPPADTRARLRGEWVRQLAGKAPGAMCEWDVLVTGAGEILDLSDPFAREAHWNHRLRPGRPQDRPSLGVTLRRLCRGNEGRVHGIAWSPDGRWLACGGIDRTIQIRDPDRGALIATLRGHAGGVRSVAWSPDGRTFASTSRHRTLRFWDMERYALIATVCDQGDSPLAPAWSPDGRTLVSGSSVASLLLWGARGRLVDTLNWHGSDARCAAWSPDGRRLASGWGDGQLVLWDVSQRRVVGRLTGHQMAVRCIASSPDGRFLASGSNDATIRIWDWATGCPVTVLRGHAWQVTAVSFGHDGRLLASRSWGGTIRLWRTDTWHPVGTIPGARSDNAAQGLAFHPSAHILAARDRARRAISLWDLNVSTILSTCCPGTSCLGRDLPC